MTSSIGSLEGEIQRLLPNCHGRSHGGNKAGPGVTNKKLIKLHSKLCQQGPKFIPHVPTSSQNSTVDNNAMCVFQRTCIRCLRCLWCGCVGVCMGVLLQELDKRRAEDVPQGEEDGHEEVEDAGGGVLGCSNSIKTSCPATAAVAMTRQSEMWEDHRGRGGVCQFGRPIVAVHR